MSTKYTYSILNDFPNQAVDPTGLTNEIGNSTITIALDYIESDSINCDIWFKADLSSAEQTTLDGLVAAHTGEEVTELVTEKRDRSGKLRVHQTSRKLGLKMFWTGEGDDPSDVTAVGNGTSVALEHNIGGSNPHIVYVDLNCVENESWLHEGYITWNDTEMDRFTVDIVPRTVNYGVPGIATAVFHGDGLNDCTSSGTYSGSTSKEYRIQIDAEGTPDTFKWSNDGGTSWTENVSITGSAQTLSDGVEVTFAATTGHTLDDHWHVNAVISSPTTYKLYGGYLVVPYVFPVGTVIDVISDLTDPTLTTEDFGGLIYMPNSDLDEAPTAYWNADWNSTTKEFENITAAPAGDGRYNIFGEEVIFARFFNKIPFLANGFICFNSSDTEQLGHGMRLKLTTYTNTTTVPDHDWSIACTICMHRAKSH